MEEITNCIRIQSNAKLKMSPEGDFFKAWVEFLKPVHDLTKREMDILAFYLKERYKLGKKISDPKMVDDVLMSPETRKKACKQCGIKPLHLNVILSTFRKKGVIRDNRIFLKLIPTIHKEGAGLMINFSFKEDEQRIKLGPQANIKKS